MEKPHKLIRLLCICVSLSVAFCIPLQAIAQSSPSLNLCQDKGIVFGFFNGVQTTRAQAGFARDEFKRLHGTSTPTGESIQYEVFYNYSKKFEDFVETFEQRLLEQDGLLEGRFELFQEAGSGGGPWWSSIVDALIAEVGIIKGYVDYGQAASIAWLASLVADTTQFTEVNYGEQRLRIDNLMLEGKKLLFVAHSQGNLFVNKAYDYTTKIKSYPAESVKVVHIAPASPRLTGKHVLADLDLVINGLRVLGSVPDITDPIPIPAFRPAGVNGNKDILGHGVIEIYINQLLDISTPVKIYINEALNTLV